MLQSNNSLVTLAVILALFGVSKPAKAISIARSDADYATYSVSNTLSQANVDPETVRDNPVNTDLEDSGSINSDLEGSGSINSDLEGSGEINRDIEGSGDFDSSFRDSGSINSDLQESGQANPDVEDSGTPLSTDDLDLEDAEISDSEVAPNNTVEGETSGAEIAEKKGSWWWWLIPVLGIPLLGLIIALGGRQRSDREPAIGNIPNRDEPNDGGLTTVGSDLSGSNNSGDVASATSRLGGAVATGGAAANVVGNSRTTESNLDLNLEQTDTIGEIPSNSVSEFTGQEAKLQVDERSTNRQEIDRDFDPLVEFSDSTAQSNVAARLGEVAASEPIAEGETTTPLTDEDNAVSTELDAPLDVTHNEADEIDLTETTVEREFRGDYVLQEETSKPFTSVNVDTATDIDTDTENSGERLDAVDNTNTSELDAIAESDPATEIDSDLAESATPVSEATTSEFYNPEINTPERESVDEFTIEEADNVIDLRQSDWDNPSETVETASATPEIDLLSDEDDSVTDSASYADRATQGGIALGSATASGIFNREQLPVQQNVEESELELNVPAETTRDTADLDTEANFNDADFSLEEITFDESDSMDLSLDEITLDDSDRSVDSSLEDLTLDESDSVDSTVDRDNASSVSLEEITFDESDSMDLSLDEITLDDSDRSVDSSLEDLTLDESDSVDSTVDRDNASSVSLEEITFDESDSMDLSLDEITLDDSDRSVDSNLEDLTLDESDSMDLSLDEITLDDSDRSVDSNLEDLTLDESDSMDLSLDEITLDDSDRSVDSNLEDLTLDESDSMDLSLDEITLDDSDRSVDSSLEDITDESLGSNDITKDLDETDNDRANLDDLGFAESESKDDLSFDLLSDNRADIAGLSDDNDDIDNITEWLDSLQTQRQDTDNISEWLDTLDTSDLDSAEENSNKDNTMELNEESEDVSFQFLEDLLERDSSPNDDER